jgi:uncharacterized cupredoxin-like copper-binding protein
MKMKLKKIISVVLATLLFSSGVLAAGDMTKQEPIEVRVQLGDSNNSMTFFPNKLEFETGKLYKLILSNSSPSKHYFSSNGFSESVFTRKTQVLDSEGKTIAEIKGVIKEIEVYPGGTAEWWFVPIKTATLTDLECTIAGHSEAGMKGSILIK